MACSHHPFSKAEKSNDPQLDRPSWLPSGSRLLPLLNLAATFWFSCAADPNPEIAQLAPPSSTAAVPAALRVAYLQARQKDAGVGHTFQAQGLAPATFAARNPLHALEATLNAQGLRIRISSEAGLPAVPITLEHYGCAATPHFTVPTPPRLAESQNRVEYSRDGVREWYVNGLLGLEHGFTLDQDPGCADGGKLVFALAVGGELAAALTGLGAAAHLELRDPKEGKSAPVLQYGDLFALDADGNELPSRMRLVGRTLRLEVDAT